ncbi:MAG TPA: fused response regulator/phosphatase [Thermoanaerobaculia bacterium]|nr:fused response regulator/phosphatase [Thermoanaerobaculia bacterium]
MKQQRIVIIDDNSNDIVLMRRVLERAGYGVSHASSGEEGITLLRNGSVDCVMVDYRMPGMDGYEVCRQIKADPQVQNIPVLMLTGADSTRNVVDGLDSGADDFVTKSSEIDVILARVRALLRVKAYQDRMAEQSEQLRHLYEEVKEKSDRIMALNQRFNKDLEIARRVQESLLPKRSLRLREMEIRSAYIPTETLSGDFYDYFIQDESLYVFVADVSGHGLPAAILVSLLKSYLHSEAGSAASLAEFMAGLNDFLVDVSLPSQFATAQLLRLDKSGSSLTFSNAAHPPFVLFERREGKANIREMPGHLLGAMRGMRFEEHTTPVGPGDLLFVYTDGLTDRKGETGEFYSIDRITTILEESQAAGIDVIYDRLYDDIAGFASTEDFRDDIAFVLTRFV